MNLRSIVQCLFALAGIGMLAGCTSLATPQGNATATPGLQFDADHYTLQTITVEGQSLAVRAYENVVYVAKPVDATYQRMNIYIPDAYFRQKTVAGFSAETAPVFLPNQVGGYMPAMPAGLKDHGFGPGRGDGPNAIQYALSRGFVVAAPGARGRTLKDAAGRYTGKAPAAIVDLKAAVSYLHYNDARMPGDATKIISNGTSAGGALSALLGASGQRQDYTPYLAELGAAPARDDIFAVSAYCPITNLDHADAAYEWQFAGIDNYKKIDISMLDYHIQRKEISGKLDDGQREVSAALQATFPDYLNSLKLRAPDGAPLSLDRTGKGSFRDYLASLVRDSAQKAGDAGKDLTVYPWLKVEQGKVTAVDYDAYLKYLGRMKTPPAFDQLDAGSGENQLFGTASIDKQHFTAFAANRDAKGGSLQADPAIIGMMNPLSYIGQPGGQVASYWRIRHGTKDSDTAQAVPVILATVLQNHGYSVDLALPWDVPHSGDYDLPALFDWAARISRSAH